MELRSVIWIPLAMLLAGCGDKKLEPVGIGQTAAFTADGVSENPFTGKKTQVHMDADLTVDSVMQVRNTGVDGQASLLLVLARIKNNSKEPLSLRGADFKLHTKTGKVYDGHRQNWTGTEKFPDALRAGRTWSAELNKLGPDMSDTMLVAFRIPLEGLQEAAYFAIGDLKLVQLKDEGSTTPRDWLVCEAFREADRVYEQFPYIR